MAGDGDRRMEKEKEDCGRELPSMIGPKIHPKEIKLANRRRCRTRRQLSWRPQNMGLRIAGDQDALRTAGIEPDEDLAAEADWTPVTAATATRLLLERSPRMTAIFVHSDTMATGVLSASARGLGRRVPADVAVVSCDDMPFAEYLTPSLSLAAGAVRRDRPSAAVELLLRSIAGEPRRRSTVLARRSS